MQATILKDRLEKPPLVMPMCYYDLLEAFPKPGCAVCQLLQRDAHHFMDALLYEYVTDFDINHAFRAGRGLCNEHSWHITQFIGTKLGITILYEAALDQVLDILQQHTPAATGFMRGLLGSSGAGLADKLEPNGGCVVCEHLNKNERTYVQAVSDALTDTRFKAAYENSMGVCLPHFRQVLRVTRDPEKQQIAVTIQSAIWQKLKAELGEYMRKNNVATAEVMGEERDSWLRAVQQLSGEKGIFGMRR